MLRSLKIIMLIVYAAFFSLISWGNIIDPQANFLFVQHVLSMDTTFKQPAVMTHAITNPQLWHLAFNIIRGWEIITALILWFGCVQLLRHFRANSIAFSHHKIPAICGLVAAFLLYMGGFIVIGGEWFEMWQSPVWNGQMKAGLFSVLILLMLIFLMQNDD